MNGKNENIRFDYKKVAREMNLPPWVFEEPDPENVDPEMKKAFERWINKFKNDNDETDVE